MTDKVKYDPALDHSHTDEEEISGAPNQIYHNHIDGDKYHHHENEHKGIMSVLGLLYKRGSYKILDHEN